MIRTCLMSGALLLMLVTPAAAFEMWIERPTSLDFVYGEVDFVVKVPDNVEVVAVELFVDGRRLGELTRPPFRLKVDVGYENREHEFRASARAADGSKGEAVVITPRLQVDEIVEVELQQLYVTVSDGTRRVLGLTRDQFQIVDEGERQSIVTFEGGDVPLTVTMLLDCSLSMKGERLTSALEGAEVFIDGMNELDRAMIMLFSDRLLRQTEFTENPDVLSAALSQVDASGGTAINDHLFIALNRLELEQGRRVVVLFSDGADVHSALEMERVLQKARASQALIYWIHLLEPGEDEVPSYTSSWRNVEKNRREFRDLQAAVRASGGRIELVRNLDSLKAAFRGIIEELREQYVLGYYPSEDRGDRSWHDVKVRVDRAGLTVRTREGYIDY